MNRLFKYELRRLLINKFFLGLLFITLLYSYYVLRGDIILGVANTAPFSGFSYGWFLSQILPLLAVTMLFFVSFFFTGEEKRVQILVRTTPVDYTKYTLLRSLAIIVGFLIISAAVVIISLVFYATIFRFTAFGAFLLPIVITLIPAMLLVLGLGLVAGRLHSGTLYALMLLLLILGQIPGFVDIFGGGFFQSYPSVVPLDATGEPIFSISASFWVSRLVYALVGIGLTGVGVSLMSKNKRI